MLKKISPKFYIILALLLNLTFTSNALASLTLSSNAITTDSVINLAGGNIGIGTVTPVSKLNIAVAPTASTNYGTLSIGGGAFDGSTSGFFGTAASSSSSGTSLAINEVSGYTGDLINAQIAGVSLLKSSVGSLAVQGSGTSTIANFTRTDTGEARFSVTGKLTNSLPSIQLISNNFNGTDFTPIPSSTQIGRIMIRGPINSSGTLNALGSTALSFSSVGTWSASNSSSMAEFRLTKAGTNTVFSPLTINAGTDTVLITGTTSDSTTNALNVNSSSAVLLIVRNDGNVGIGTATPTELFDLNSNNMRIRTAKTPSSASDTCDQGEIAWDASFSYVCIATNTWHRSAHATW